MNTKNSIAIILVGAACSSGTIGCSSWNRMNATERGAVTGGAIGSGLGAIVGSQVGAAGPGIAIGGGAGAATGAIIGHEFDQHSTRQASIEERQRRQEAKINSQQRELNEIKKSGTAY